MGKSDKFDGIILGAGHNGLILQTYLGRAGFRTVSLECQPRAGGGLTTVEYPEASGFVHNTHSFFHRALNQMPWYRELELEKHGARYIEPSLNVALITEDRCLQWWKDFDQTEASFAKVHAGDAKKLRYWKEQFHSIVRDFLVPAAQAPPLPQNQWESKLLKSAEGRLLLETAKLSPWEFVKQEFEHPLIQAGLLFFNGLREVDLRLPGFGHHIPSLLASDGLAQMCIGGSSRLADALIAAVTESGGEIRTNTVPDQILIEGNRVCGVRTSEGQEIRASRFIASSLNPQQTFCQLIEAKRLPKEWRSQAEAFQYNLLAPLFSLHVNLREPPAYKLAEEHPELDDAFMVIMGLHHSDQFPEIIRHHEQGTIPETVMWGACPTRFDATQATNGHTAFMWEKLPFHLQGDADCWSAAAEAHGEKILDCWNKYAPHMKDSVLDSFTQTPRQIQESLWNMTDGDLLVGAFSGGQVGCDRPFPGAGHYRTCVEGLYLCGSCCHPGGNVTGLPGRNAAQVVMSDLR